MKKGLAVGVAAALLTLALPAKAFAGWGAIAAGIDEYGGGAARVSVGSALNHPTEESARRAAMQKCREGGVKNCRIQSTFTGCGYVTVSRQGSRPVAWGMGPNAQSAYDNCYSRIREGNCEKPIGGCNN